MTIWRIALILVGIATFIAGLFGTGVDSWMGVVAGPLLAAYVATDPLAPWNRF